MNAKKIGVFIGIVVLLMLGVCFGAYQCGAKNERDSAGATGNTEQQRELLARIGEYEQRERERIAAENSRVAREGERIEHTKAQLRAIRGLDRRERDLYEELTAEIGILADYLDSSERDLAGCRGDGAGGDAALEIEE
jgi:hypothetical protein